MNDLKGKKVAIIGGAGFIGHHLAVHLKTCGAEVHIIDGLQVNNVLSLSSTANIDKNRDFYLSMVHERLDILRSNQITLHTQDARDYHALSKLHSAIKPNYIVHLAAVAHAGRSNKDPFSTFDHSLRTLENALDVCRDTVEHFVYFSSSMVYGNFQTSSVSEDHPLEPIGIYGALKLAGEKMVIAYHQVFGLPYTIIRPSALYGQRCISRRVIQIFIESILADEAIQIEGDGQEKLDFTFIKDLEAGIECVLKQGKPTNSILNMTFGASRSIEDLVGVLRGYFPQLNVVHKKRDDLVPFRGTLNIEKAKSLVGYQPQFPLEKGLAEYIAWYRKIFKKPVL